jgi:hypothetical protein
MVSNQLMQKVVTAILQNTDEFATIQTFRGCLVDDPLTGAQREAAEQIGKRLFAMNAAAIKARYGTLPQRPSFNLAGWADATPVEQLKAMRCLLYQACEGSLPNGRPLQRAEPGSRRACAADRARQASPEYEKAPWG